jgi:hypothetical protein
LPGVEAHCVETKKHAHNINEINNYIAVSLQPAYRVLFLYVSVLATFGVALRKSWKDQNLLYAYQVQILDPRIEFVS